MPNYNYHCKNCEANFSIFTSMNDRRNDITCNLCESSNVFRIYSRILTKTSGSSKGDIAPATTSSGGGCGSCSSSGCGTCH